MASASSDLIMTPMPAQGPCSRRPQLWTWRVRSCPVSLFMTSRPRSASPARALAACVLQSLPVAAERRRRAFYLAGSSDAASACGAS
jgi:hypothetical protein